MRQLHRHGTFPRHSSSARCLPTSGAPSTETTCGNTFTVKFIQALDDGNNGLSAGVEATFTVTASVPSGVSASYNGQTVQNPVTVTATNVPTPGTATAGVLLTVPTTLSVDVFRRTVSADVGFDQAHGVGDPIQGRAPRRRRLFRSAHA